MFICEANKKEPIARPLVWAARKIGRVVKSTFAAEAVAAVNGVDEAIYMARMVKEL